MPRGKPKTHFELVEERIYEKLWRERKLEEKPPRSRCIGLRFVHSFGRGSGSWRKKCMFCHKSREQIKEEQKRG